MLFTYEAYERLVDSIHKKEYEIINYNQSNVVENGIILRHDIDFSIEKACRFAMVERELGIKSTYFFLLSGDFYNVFSLKSINMINDIAAAGHDIGLHFDEMRYHYGDDISQLIEYILEEIDLFSKMSGMKIDRVSMHRPSKLVLESDIEIPGVINTYSQYFFKEFKYVSDSRHVWREPIESYIEDRLYSKIQILIHPFWYNDTEKNISDSIKGFVQSASRERYYQLQDNIMNLNSLMPYGEIGL